MANITGLITVNEKDVLEVDADPSAGAGTPANRASLAMFDTGAVGQLWLKKGATDTEWELVETSTGAWDTVGNTLTGGTPTTPNEFFGSNNDYDLVFKRNAIELMRAVGSAAATQGLLIGLNASIGGRLQLMPSAQGDDILKEISETTNQIIHVTRMFRVTTVSNAAATFNVAVPNDYSAQIIAKASGRQTGGATGAVGDSVSYIRTSAAKNVGGAVTVLKTQTDFTYEVAVGFNFTPAASGANVQYTAQGAINRNMSWGLHVTLLLTTT